MTTAVSEVSVPPKGTSAAWAILPLCKSILYICGACELLRYQMGIYSSSRDIVPMAPCIFIALMILNYILLSPQHGTLS